MWALPKASYIKLFFSLNNRTSSNWGNKKFLKYIIFNQSQSINYVSIELSITQCKLVKLSTNTSNLKQILNEYFNINKYLSELFLPFELVSTLRLPPNLTQEKTRDQTSLAKEALHLPLQCHQNGPLHLLQHQNCYIHNSIVIKGFGRDAYLNGREASWHNKY